MAVVSTKRALNTAVSHELVALLLHSRQVSHKPSETIGDERQDAVDARDTCTSRHDSTMRTFPSEGGGTEGSMADKVRCMCTYTTMT